ncbi:MFS transporter [Actinokineospora soli]|uniref:MFS transporter n=1 Tax=Actinokineospora soli TaxID=1048753 RepID=A0ABW2TTE2_9PSEU
MSRAQAWVLGLASLASFMMALDSLVVSTALTTIRQDLSASVESLEWTVTAYNLAFAVLLLTGAALGDRFGRKRVFVIGLAVFTAASAACALSPGIGALIAARVAQGVGAAMVLPLSLTLISAAFPPQRRGKAMGVYLGITGLATFSGPFIGGVIAEGLAWQWIFWLNLPVGVVAIALTALRVEEGVGPNNRLDVGGVVLVTLGAFGVVWGLVRGNAAGWGARRCWARWRSGSRCWPRSSRGSGARPRRCCRCGSSGCARSPRPTRRTSACSRRSTGRCSSWRSTSRTSTGTGRSRRA